jgi:hypothetical protein
MRNNNNTVMRRGTLNIGLLGPNSTISDTYDTMNDAVLPHEFVVIDSGDFAVLAYNTSSTEQVSFSYKTNFWKS